MRRSERVRGVGDDRWSWWRFRFAGVARPFLLLRVCAEVHKATHFQNALILLARSFLSAEEGGWRKRRFHCAMGRRNKGKAVKEGASSMDVMDVATSNGGGAEAMAVEGEAAVAASPEPLIAAIRIAGDEGAVTPSEHTSSDYYFDSYAHFGEWVL